MLAIGSQSDLIVFFNNGSSFTSSQTYPFGYSTIWAIDITADGKWIAVAGANTEEIIKNKVSVFTYQHHDNTYRELQSFFGENTGAYAVTISHDHQWLVWGEGN